MTTNPNIKTSIFVSPNMFLSINQYIMKLKFSILTILLFFLSASFPLAAQKAPQPFDIDTPSLRVFLPAPELATGRQKAFQLCCKAFIYSTRRNNILCRTQNSNAYRSFNRQYKDVLCNYRCCVPCSSVSSGTVKGFLQKSRKKFRNNCRCG